MESSDFHDPDFSRAAALADGKFRRAPSWVRASRLPKSGARLPLFESIDPTDISQGGLGDCWLVAAISCLAEYPEEVEACFVGHGAEATVDGKYTVRLYDVTRQCTRELVLDEHVPCFTLGPREFIPGYEELAYVPLYGRPATDIWALLLEKAFAKLVGSYRRLQGGQEAHAFRALTGCTRQEQWSCCAVPGGHAWRNKLLLEAALNQWRYGDEQLSTEQFFERLETFATRRYLIAASIPGDAMEGRRADGLITRHAYSVLQALQLVDAHGATHRLLKLRNPWGGDEWNGAWSDKSDEWAQHPEIRDALGVTVADDGVFYMGFDDFARGAPLRAPPRAARHRARRPGAIDAGHERSSAQPRRPHRPRAQSPPRALTLPRRRSLGRLPALAQCSPSCR